MLKSERITQSPSILSALLSNPNLSGIQSENIRNKIEQATAVPAEPDTKAEVHSAPEDVEQEPEEVFQAAPGDEIQEAAEATTVIASAGKATGAASKKAPIKKTQLNPTEERGSALQKIAKLDIKGRIQLAMKGTKEERSLLIRDGTKIVAL